MSQHDRYISPFSTRYSSDEMQYIFSDVTNSAHGAACGWRWPGPKWSRA